MEKVDLNKRLETLGDDFKQTRKIFLDSYGILQAMELKQKETRDSFATSNPFVSIHQYAK